MLLQRKISLYPQIILIFSKDHKAKKILLKMGQTNEIFHIVQRVDINMKSPFYSTSVFSSLPDTNHFTKNINNATITNNTMISAEIY